jgi:hypothetical protein
MMAEFQRNGVMLKVFMPGTLTCGEPLAQTDTSAKKHPNWQIQTAAAADAQQKYIYIYSLLILT